MREPHLAAPGTISGKECFVTVGCINHVITQLTLLAVDRVEALFALLQSDAVCTVFGKSGIKTEIGVLQIQTHTVITIHLVVRYDVREWYDVEQVSDLINERLSEIIIACVRSGIPLVAPPIIPADGRHGRFGRHDAEDLFARAGAGALIKIAKVSEYHPPHRAAFPTPRR